MNIAEAIHNHPMYIQNYKKLQSLEADRIFCGHHINHFLDVARIAYIMNLEQRLGIRKDVIYAAALLHDIGRGEQYEHGMPHELASAQIAEIILADIPQEAVLSEGERADILAAIRSHRNDGEDTNTLARLLYEGDKASRPCYECEAYKECNWPNEKKNRGIIT